MKKIFAIILALAMTFALSATALAQDVPTGQGGNGTITVQNAAIGKKYTLRKIFDATYSDGAASYTTDNTTFIGHQNDADFPFDLVALGGGVYSVKKKTASSEQDVLDWIKEHKTDFTAISSDVEATDNTLKFTGLKPGYYLITSDLGDTTAVTITNASPDANVVDKNKAAGIETDGKQVQTGTTGSGENITPTWGAENSAGIGGTVTFKITANVPKYNGSDTAITSYKFVDDMGDGLDFVSISSVVITEGNNSYTLSQNNALADGKYTLTVDSDNHGFTLEFNPSICTGYPASGVVTIIYTATVNKNATAENCYNKVTMYINGAAEPTTPKTDTDVLGFVIHKIDGSDNSELTGAQFSLWDAETGGNQIPVVKVSDGHYRVAVSGETGVVIDAGVAYIWGLAAGTYYLQEDLEPNGYNRLTERQAVTINKSVCNSTTYPNYLDPVNVKNNKGATLPSVGGIGTTIFYIIGGLLMVGAAVLLVVRKKMSVTE